MEDIQSIYDYDIQIIDQGRSRLRKAEETRIGIKALAKILDVKATFDRYRLGWMGEPFGFYSLEVVCELYDYFSNSSNLITPVRKRALDHPPLAHTLVRSILVTCLKRYFRDS